MGEMGASHTHRQGHTHRDLGRWAQRQEVTEMEENPSQEHSPKNHSDMKEKEQRQTHRQGEQDGQTADAVLQLAPLLSTVAIPAADRSLWSH